jgi:murein DD-endopeptidase MepM/ murein hydrolase activator NlpD
MKIKFYYFIILFFIAKSVFAQVQLNDGNVHFFENPLSQTQECVPEKLRKEINIYLAENIKKLRLNNTASIQTHPQFIFPLRKVATLSDFSMYVILNFIDHNSAVGPGSFNQYTATNLDYNCGNRSYDTNGGYNHPGVDIALFPYEWQKMKENAVEVVAAASGIIIGKYDGNSSFSCGSSSGPNWNAVFVQHADNSVAWYGHLKQSTLTLKPVGSTVEQGEYLGVVGSSGNSSGPHLHFEVHDVNNQTIDPFVGACNPSVTESWWQSQLPYLDKTLNTISTHLSQPVTNQCPSTNNKVNYSFNIRKNSAGYFYHWGRQIQQNDGISFSLIRPNGSTYTTNNASANNNYLTFYFYWTYFISSSEPSGLWKVHTVFDGKTHEKSFNLVDPTDIITSLDNSAFCAGENLTVSHSIGSGSYPAGNVFTAQLSNSSGSFASPTTIGSTTTQFGGTISCTIPSGISAGNGYRIRVVASTGAYVSVDNGYDILLKKVPSATLTGTSNIAPGQSATLSVALNGGGPYNVVLSNDAGKTFETDLGSFVVAPASTTTYTLTSLQNACGTGTVSGSAIVSVTTCSSLVILDNPADNYSSGTVTKQALATSGTIEATNQIMGLNTRVTYQAHAILLKNGFKADNGTIFKAEIGGCN